MTGAMQGGRDAADEHDGEASERRFTEEIEEVRVAKAGESRFAPPSAGLLPRQMIAERLLAGVDGKSVEGDEQPKVDSGDAGTVGRGVWPRGRPATCAGWKAFVGGGDPEVKRCPVARQIERSGHQPGR